MQKTLYYSWKNKELCKGCKLCVQGKKLVLFITGLCSRKCFYCPLSERKKNKDKIWANEWDIKHENDVIKEARLCESEGAGITGGDPLLRLSRTIMYIKRLKREFGSEFHIHLYAPLIKVSKDNLEKLYNAGLDEIRFHPNLNDNKYWRKVEWAKKFPWQVGIEIPMIPNMKKQTIELVDYFKDIVDFFNFNELEFSDTNAQNLMKFNLHTKDRESYAVKGSQELAFELMKKYPMLRIHYCTSRLKDRVQLANRIKRRAKNAANKFDKITKSGTLVRGAIYLNETKPGIGYRKKLSKLTKDKKKKLITKLNKLKEELKEDFGNKFVVDYLKYRILTSTNIVKKAAKKYKNCAIVEEYPTHDGMEVELEFI